jgi:hypothetical protein
VTKLLLIVILLIGGLALSHAQGKKSKGRQNHPPVISVFSLSVNTVIRCDHLTPPSYPGCTEEEVKLNIVATDPDNDHLSYRYELSGGSIIKKENATFWTLKNVPMGSYSATVFVTDGRSREVSSMVKLRVVESTRWEFLTAPCPFITLECPEKVNRDERTRFNAVIKGGQTLAPKYVWTVNWGKIVGGEGTSTIDVVLKGPWGENLIVKLEVGGYDPSCVAEASCTVKISEGKE